MKNSVLLLSAFALIGLAGCDSMETAGSGLANGVSNPGTPVNATATYEAEATDVTYRDSGPSNNNRGTCTTGGRYVTRSGNQTQTRTSEPNHPQCATRGSGTGTMVTITFSEVANYVLSTNGNIQLNFSRVNDLPRGVQHKRTSNTTSGFGVLVSSSASEGNVWVMDLSQIDQESGTYGLESATRAINGLMVCRADDANVCAFNGSMSWMPL
jgi:hypothetical protein